MSNTEYPVDQPVDKLSEQSSAVVAPNVSPQQSIPRQTHFVSVESPGYLSNSAPFHFLLRVVNIICICMLLSTIYQFLQAIREMQQITNQTVEIQQAQQLILQELVKQMKELNEK